jgi:two-component system chemotaxis response regulator CheY
MEIYCIDDDMISRMALVDIVQPIVGAGAHLVEFDGAVEAWERLQTAATLPALVCCDVRMPEMTGLEFLEKVRGEAKTRELPVCLITSANDPETIKKAMSLQVTGFLIKPFSHDDAVTRLNKVLSVVRSRQMESPAATMARLKLTAERYTQYVSGLQKQVSMLMIEVGNSSSEESWDAIKKKCGALETGCITLGMRQAADMFRRAKDGEIERNQMTPMLVEVNALFHRQIYSIE